MLQEQVPVISTRKESPAPARADGMSDGDQAVADPHCRLTIAHATYCGDSRAPIHHSATNGASPTTSGCDTPVPLPAPAGRFPLGWLIALAATIAAIVILMRFEPGVKYMGPGLYALTLFRHLIEALCGVYAVCFLVAAVRYVWRANRATTRQEGMKAGTQEANASMLQCLDASMPSCITKSSVAIIYLCCNDLEPEAVESLSTLRHDGALIHILHDDSTEPAENQRVDRIVQQIAHRTGVEWRVLRRPHKAGGKPAALQYVLDATALEHEFFLLADNDSYVTDPDLIRRALPSFTDPGVGVVQFRNRARVNSGDGGFAVTLSGAIDMFDAFMTGLFDGLWRPFVGHNALLRTRNVVEAGGLTPGFFADDIDLTVRMNLRGRRVIYRRDLSMEECHPSNYRSFCLRAKKWAHGCAQIIRTHLWDVLCSRIMTWREKLGFLLFTGFYVAQVAMLAYIVLVFLALPLLIGSAWKVHWWAFGLGTIVPIAIFLPVLAYLLTEGRRLPFFRTLGCCAATYGSTDLWTLLGLAGGFSRKQRRWIPTNSVLNGSRPLMDWGHFTFGASFLLVPLALQPQLLIFPVTWLFAAKYLFVPAVAVHYDARKSAPSPAASFAAPSLKRLVFARSIAIWAFVFWTIAALALAPIAFGSESVREKPRVEVQGERLLIDGKALIIRGIHYSPWRPGTGPGRGFDYPSDEQIAPDLAMIQSLKANTILVYDPPSRVLDLAHRHDLRVIYVFSIQWWMLASDRGDEITDEIVERVREMRGKPAVIAWMLGNEIPGWVIDQLSADGVRTFLSTTRGRVREVDPHRPVCHGNWPLHRMMDLDRDMDLLCYNVYPFYPTEVVASGYGRFIAEQIKPLAKGRPLLITEFGTNTIEVSPPRQAEVLRECWRDLLKAGAQGGVVFAFADEWWKNYDNPIAPPDWWRRQEAPDDHLAHDADPEEHYGIVTSDRIPKPAFVTVREMFAETPDYLTRGLLVRTLWWLGASASIALIFTALWLRVRGSGTSGSRVTSPGSPGSPSALRAAANPLP